MPTERAPAPLVVIHGLVHGCGHVRREPRDGARAIRVPDLPGYGTNDPGTVTSIDRSVAFLDAWMEELGLDDVHLAGHSAGGAIAMVLADRRPGRVRTIVDVEGNFTLRDAFWSKGIAEGTEEEAEALLAGFRADVRGWLEGQAIDPTPPAMAWARASLEAQTGRTLWTMSRSIVDTTSVPAYLALVERVVARGTPVHLVAGARSADGWDVPPSVRARSASSVVLADVGHMMMLEDAAALVAAMEDAVGPS